MSRTDEASTGTRRPEDDGPQWLGEAEQRAWRSYIWGARTVEKALDEDLQRHGVQLTEYEILAMLAENSERGLRMSVLADLVVQSRSRLTHTAARLERRGWVERRRSADDGRGIDLFLTTDGLETVERLSRVHIESVRRNVVDLLSHRQFLELGSTLERIRSGIARGGAAPAGPSGAQGTSRRG